MSDTHIQRRIAPHGRCRHRQGKLPQRCASLLSRLVREEQGGETLEYAIVAGLIVVGAIGLIGKVGTKVLARWTSLNSSL